MSRTQRLLPGPAGTRGARGSGAEPGRAERLGSALSFVGLSRGSAPGSLVPDVAAVEAQHRLRVPLRLPDEPQVAPQPRRPPGTGPSASRRRRSRSMRRAAAGSDAARRWALPPLPPRRPAQASPLGAPAPPPPRRSLSVSLSPSPSPPLSFLSRT